MKSSNYRGQSVSLYVGQIIDNDYGLVALVRPACRQSANSQLTFYQRPIADHLTPDYRYANGMESGYPTPPCNQSPMIDRRSIGNVSSNGVALFADGSAFHRTKDKSSYTHSATLLADIRKEAS